MKEVVILGYPRNTDPSKKKILSIELNENDELMIAGKNSTFEHLAKTVTNFLKVDSSEKAIRIRASREASYDSYTKLINLVKCQI